ncbi:hypothetical protein P280DRAFT_474856 [Massarina eburnea CBS 473.64]|uniref:Uncharacterized protein n=1 Tax=Massarina eburnea CBS 473.64 TaxID=1395130 RepID=A0A6A6RI72_9PLEO|nr:hypothetical protein P280DRAFT_474856 [Massarina eburnea CBS 473.64]
MSVCVPRRLEGVGRTCRLLSILAKGARREIGCNCRRGLTQRICGAVVYPRSRGWYGWYGWHVRWLRYAAALVNTDRRFQRVTAQCRGAQKNFRRTTGGKNDHKRASWKQAQQAGRRVDVPTRGGALEPCWDDAHEDKPTPDGEPVLAANGRIPA